LISSPLKLGRTLIDTEALDEGIARLAREVDRDQAGRPALLVGILKGSVFFLCDLAKRLKTPVSLDFLQVSSYGDGTRSSGNVRLVRDLTTDVAGKDVIIVEDIVDTGRTLSKIKEILGTHRGRVRGRLRSRPRRGVPKPALHCRARAGRRAPVKPVSTNSAPRAIGPYSQAIVEGGFLFASGQVPLDPATGRLVEGGLEASAERVLDNLEAILSQAGLAFMDVVKTTVYLTRAEDFAAMNAVYARRFGEHRPARSTVIVAALPAGAPLEIDLIARFAR
jgi:2-iminobutanoate/2-iminopropanoate deaminase